MDCVGYKEMRFNEIKSEVVNYLHKVGVSPDSIAGKEFWN
jgi:translation elongation factor EF-1alpha